MRPKRDSSKSNGENVAGVSCTSKMEMLWKWTILTGTTTTMISVTRCCSIDIATMSVMPSWRKPKRSASDWQTQVSISNDHTLKILMKAHLHIQFGIGCGRSDLNTY